MVAGALSEGVCGLALAGVCGRVVLSRKPAAECVLDQDCMAAWVRYGL